MNPIEWLLFCAAYELFGRYDGSASLGGERVLFACADVCHAAGRMIEGGPVDEQRWWER